MNVEFHYYTVYYLATAAGMSDEDASVLAYSSQYLDNALVAYEVAHDRGTYVTQVTHHFGFWDRSQEWDVWIPFHFFPAGDQSTQYRRDGAANPLVVRANGPLVKRLLVDALRSRDLYRVGIALHTYADTWAHEHWSGRNEVWNRVDPTSPLPPIGHAQALRDPDSIDTVWSDPRLEPPHDRVDNRTRFLAAAARVYRYLSTYTGSGFADEDLVIDRLTAILGRPGTSSEERIADFVIECGMQEYSRRRWRVEAFTPPGGWANRWHLTELESAVDKLHWLRDEMLHKTRLIGREPVRANPGFFSSDLYRWDQAAIAQRSAALRLLEPIRAAVD